MDPTGPLDVRAARRNGSCGLCAGLSLCHVATTSDCLAGIYIRLLLHLFRREYSTHTTRIHMCWVLTRFFKALDLARSLSSPPR